MKNIPLLSIPLRACAVLVFTSHVSYAANFSDAPPPAKIDKAKYSPYPEQNYPNRVFFGDTREIAAAEKYNQPVQNLCYSSC